MKRKRLIVLILGLFLITVISAPVFAVSYFIPSRVEFDSSFQGSGLEDKYYKLNITTQEEAERYPFVWWRDTTNQNNLWAHSETQFTNQLITAYSDDDTKVLVWAGQNGPNVVAIVGPTGNTIIGTGGSRAAARVALNALNNTVPDFQVNLRGIILTEANKEFMWGGAEWIGVNVNRTAPVLIYAYATIFEVYAVKQAVSTANVQRELYTYAPQLPYGPNGNLGVGSLLSFNPYQPDNGLVQPNRFVSSETTIVLGGVSMTLKPTAPEDAGMAVYLPTKKVLILGELFGKYFPPYGAITGSATNMPPTRWITVLDNMKKMNADILVPLHTLPITNAADVVKALGDSKDALTSIHTQVVQKINAMMSEDDIVASVKIPEPLASQPYTQEYASSVECTVRAIYHYYLGWFDWEVDSLNTLGEREQASFIVELAGGGEKALASARAYETDHTMAGVQKAIIICKALRIAAPSHDADVLYIQALEKMGYSQESGQLRNFYLLTAQRAEATMQSASP